LLVLIFTALRIAELLPKALDMAVPLLKVPSHVAGAHWPVWCDGYKMAFQEMTGIKPTRKLLREFLFFVYKGHKLLHVFANSESTHFNYAFASMQSVG
jgi:hypothetical protein